MQVIDYSAFDHLSEKQRNVAVSLLGDGLEARQAAGFGIAVSDKLFYVTQRDNSITTSFAGLLPVELAEVHDILVTVPHQPRIWDSAMSDFLRWARGAGQSEDANQGLGQILSLARRFGSQDRPLQIMLGQSGIATVSSAGMSFMVNYVPFSSIRSLSDYRSAAADDVSMPLTCLGAGYQSPPSEQVVHKLLSGFELAEPSSDYDRDGSFFLAVASIDRARLSSTRSPDPEEAQAAARHLVMARA